MAVTSWYLNHCFVLYTAVSFGLAFIAVQVVFQCVSRRECTRVFTSQVHLEQIWTWLPIGYLLVTVGQSLLCLYGGEAQQTTTLSLTVVAQQWYWGVGGVTSCGMDVGTLSDCRLVIGSELTLGGNRLGTASQPTFIPVSTTATTRLTSLDVIHGWSLPALGMRVDCVPGRVSCINVGCNSPGTYVGYCSELCGVGHGFMPINVVVYDSVSAPVTAAPQPLQGGVLDGVISLQRNTLHGTQVVVVGVEGCVNAEGSMNQGDARGNGLPWTDSECGLSLHVSEEASLRATNPSNNMGLMTTVLQLTVLTLALEGMRLILTGAQQLYLCMKRGLRHSYARGASAGDHLGLRRNGALANPSNSACMRAGQLGNQGTSGLSKQWVICERSTRYIRSSRGWLECTSIYKGIQSHVLRIGTLSRDNHATADQTHSNTPSRIGIATDRRWLRQYAILQTHAVADRHRCFRQYRCGSEPRPT